MVRALYYTALVENQEYSAIRPLVDWLDYNGFTMVTKPAKEFTDATGRRKLKGNMDIELAVDMMELSANIDHAVLFSGDGDFRRLVESVQRKGVRVTVVSTVKTQPAMIADELRRQADFFIELKDLEKSWAEKSLYAIRNPWKNMTMMNMMIMKRKTANSAPDFYHDRHDVIGNSGCLGKHG